MAGPMLGLISNKVAKSRGVKIGVKGTRVQRSKMAPFEDKTGKRDQGAGKITGIPGTRGKTIDKNQSGGRMSKQGGAGRETQPKTDGGKKWPTSSTVKASNKGSPKLSGPIYPSGPLYGGPNGRP